LAIAAALLGARVIAVDYDDQAVLATQENAEFNQISDRVETFSLTEFERNQQRWIGHFDVVVANILAAPIIELAPTFSQVLARPGQLVLSGILDYQAQQVVDGYPEINFAPMTSEAEWVCLTGTRD
jgi:ribosomal protein L11 methyltransferase